MSRAKRAVLRCATFLAILTAGTAEADIVDSIPGLRLWLDASDLGTLWQDTGGSIPVVFDGDPIARWDDKSGSGQSVTQGGAGDQPNYVASVGNLNFAPALHFDGDALVGPNNFTGITGNADRTVISVWSNAINTGQHYQHTFHMGDSTGNEAYGHSVFRTEDGMISNHYWNSGFSTNASGLTDPILAVTMWDGDGGTAGNGLDSWWINGDPKNGDDRGALATGASQLTIGSRLDPSTEGIRGDIAEVIVYDRVLTPAEHNAVGLYLTEKYGLSTSYFGVDHELTWDGQAAPGNWADPRWTGGDPGEFPEIIGNNGDKAFIHAGAVTVAADRGAFSAEVDGGSLTIGPNNTLRLLTEITVGPAATFTMNDGARLVTPTGSLVGVNTTGNATIEGAATASHLVMVPNGTFTKAGSDTLSFDQSVGANVIDNTNTIQVSGGELRMQVAASPNPIGGADLNLDGGTFTVQGTSSFENVLNVGRFDDGNFQQDFSANGGAYTDDASGIFSGQQLLSGMPGIELQQTGPLSYANSNAFNNFFFGSDGNTDQWQAVWTGYFVAQNAGVHQFRIQSAGGGGIDDDGSLWIDDDQSGTFDADEGGTTGGQLAQTTNVALTPGQMVAVAFGFNENGGGESYRVQFMEPAGTYTSWTTVDPTGQAGYWRAQSVDPVDMSDTDVFVSADSTLNAISDATAAFGALTFTADATLTISGARQGISFPGTTFAGGVTAVGVNTDIDTDLGVIDDGGVGITITKGGPRRLILNNGTANTLGAASTLNVVDGSLVVVMDPDNPLRDAAIRLGGGTLALSIASGTAGDGGTLTFDKPLTVTGGNSVLTAGQHANGLAGPKTIVMGSATDGFNLTGGDLTVTTTDGYSLEIPGPLTGGGGLIIDGPNVTIGTGGTIGRFGIYAGATGLVGKERVVATNRYDFTDVTIDYDLGTGFDAAAEVHIGNDDVTEAPVILNGTNVYTGMTQIRRGVLRADEGVGLPAASLLNFNSNNNDQVAVLETSGTFTRNIGNNPGEVYWQDRGGFAARGGDLIVTLEGGADLIWGDADVGFNGQGAIQFGSITADGMVELTNNIDLGGADRRIQVVDNPNVKTDFVRLTGNITGSDATDDLRFNESSGNNFNGGLVELLGVNTYQQRTRIDDMAVFAIEGTGLPLDSNLLFSGNSDSREAIFMSNGVMDRDIGDGPGEVSWDNAGDPDGQRGGFAARGGRFTVRLEGGATLDWGSGTSGFDGRRLQLGSQYADDVVTLTNSIDGGDANRDINLFDNPDVDTDYAVLEGNLTNIQRLRTFGSGTLVFNGDVTLNNTDDDRLQAENFTIQVHNGVVTIPSNTNGGAGDIELYDSGQVFINNVANVADDVIFNGNADDAGDNAGFGGSGQVNLTNTGNIIEFHQNTHARPGDRGVGTLSAELNAGEWEMESNSIYEYEIAEGSHDLIALTSSVPGAILDLRNSWQIDLINAGIAAGIDPSQQFDLFTYDDNVTLQFNGTDQSGSGAVTNFALAGVPPYWDVSGLEIRFEPAVGGNHVFLTGLAAPPVLVWDNSDSNWSEVLGGDSHWEGGATPADLPTAAHAAEVNAGKATVANPGQQALILAINGGEVAVASGGVLDIAQSVDVAPAGTFSVAGGGTINAPTINSAGTTNFQSGAAGNVGTLNVSGGTTTSHLPTFTNVNVSDGALDFNAPTSVDEVKVRGGTVRLGGAGNLSVNTMDVTAGTVDTGANYVTVANKITLGATRVMAEGGTAFNLGGTDLLNPSAAQHRTLSLSGSQATLAAAGDMPGGLALWLDASDGGTLFQDTAGTNPVTADGQPVARWNDKSPSGIVASQGSAGDRPEYRASVASLNDLPALFFDGGAGGDSLISTTGNSTGISGNADRTVITVWSDAEGTGQNYQHTFHMGDATGNEAYGHSVSRIDNGGQIGNHYWSAGFDATSSGGLGAPNIAVSTWDGDGGTAGNGLDSWFVNGAPVGASDRGALATGTDQLTVGSRLNPSTEGIRGNIAEILVFDRVLTAEELNDVGGFLAEKYDIGTSYTGNLGGLIDEPFTDVEVTADSLLGLDTDQGAALGNLMFDLTGATPGDTLLDISSEATSIDFADLVLDGPAAPGDYTLLNWLDKPPGSTPFSDAMFDNVVFNGLAGTLSFADSTVTLSVGGAQAVPEPSTLVLAALGLLGLAWCARRRKKP